MLADMTAVAIVAGLVAAALGAAAAVVSARKQAQAALVAARAEAASLVKSAKLEAASRRRAAETEAREAALELRAEAEAELGQLVEDLARRDERVAAREAQLDEDKVESDGRWAEFKARKKAIQTRRDEAKSVFEAADALLERMRDELARRAGETPDATRDRLARGWIEHAEAAAANRIRTIEHSGSDPAYDRDAKRMLEIASSRYRNHFLTERLISRIALQPGVPELLTAADGAMLHSIADVANVQLEMQEDGESLRLQGLDGVGREIARRALSRLGKPKHKNEAIKDPPAWVGKIRDHLHREIQNLGKKAFSVLKVKSAHPEIVDLVGRLNYRTSYTQNQWLHAVEASFLCGMMAEEMGLDVGMARRACLLHDIGKSLTHEIEGSHAVIGADIARRLGEDEVVANAIGSHHADEPPTSVYAYLVAAGDAMSGARPGARRAMTTEYGSRIEDLERIGSSYRGVDRAFAVHGGRELRVYVEEGRLSDLEVVELSSEIA